jgi:hypothetical protein
LKFAFRLFRWAAIKLEGQCRPKASRRIEKVPIHRRKIMKALNTRTKLMTIVALVAVGPHAVNQLIFFDHVPAAFDSINSTSKTFGVRGTGCPFFRSFRSSASMRKDPNSYIGADC